MSATFVKHVIDMDADPYVPANWKVESHKKGGRLEFNSKKIKLYLSVEQEGNKWIAGNDLQKELETQIAYNANLLDYLLVHTELISESWKDKVVCFWNTKYRSSNGCLGIRCLYLVNESWRWAILSVYSDFSSYYPAAVADK